MRGSRATRTGCVALVLVMVAGLRMMSAAAAGGGPVANSVTQAFRPGTASTASTVASDYTGELLTLQAVDTGWPTAEPTIGVGPDGTAYFAAASLDVDTSLVWGVAQTHTLRSTDGGVTWELTQLRIPVADVSILPGNADPFVWVDTTGRVFNIDLYAGCSWANISDDKGNTWIPNPAACGIPVNDHQTIGGGLPRGGHTTELGYPNALYYCANQLVQTGCGRSFDGGLVWTPTPSHPFPATNNNAGCVGLTGHVRTDPEGRVFLPKGCSRPWVAISGDSGDTWTRVRVDNTLTPALPHTSVAADAAGNLYYVWLSDAPGGLTNYLPFLSVSTDHGATWSVPKMIAPPGVKHANFPVISAGDAGRIAINFPGTTSQNVNATAPWNQYVVVAADALGADPIYLSATANDPADPIHRGACLGRCSGMWDFIDITVSAAGEAWAAAADTCVAACVSPGTATLLKAGRGVAIRQIGGPKLRG